MVGRLELKVKKVLGQQLRTARVEAGYKHANQFARVIKAVDHTYRSWERGECTPDIPTLNRICIALKKPPNYFLPMAVPQDSPNE
jgi:DNA-binding XRE family transcriptional regulator